MDLQDILAKHDAEGGNSLSRIGRIIDKYCLSTNQTDKSIPRYNRTSIIILYEMITEGIQIDEIELLLEVTQDVSTAKLVSKFCKSNQIKTKKEVDKIMEGLSNE